MSELEKIELPTWLDGMDAKALANVAQEYWQTIESYLFWWLEQLDAENSALPILDLLAWERGIDRLDGESIELYSLRIKHAVANSEDAGYGIGMERIFKRLGFGYIEINERVPTYDWDMVEIAMMEDEFDGKQSLVEELIKQYGRTCRRYFLSVLSVINVYVVAGIVEFEKEVVG
jgi:hypothetical protein